MPAAPHSLTLHYTISFALFLYHHHLFYPSSPSYIYEGIWHPSVLWGLTTITKSMSTVSTVEEWMDGWMDEGVLMLSTMISIA